MWLEIYKDHTAKGGIERLPKWGWEGEIITYGIGLIILPENIIILA